MTWKDRLNQINGEEEERIKLQDTVCEEERAGGRA